MTTEIISTFIIILLVIILCYFIYLYLKSYFKIKELKNELNKQDLDYYLKKIELAGYDYTIKSGKSTKKNKKNNISKDKNNSKKSKKDKPKKTFKDLIEKD
jgi:lipopolysaccharide export system protein LptC